jgi:hypothetical protein
MHEIIENLFTEKKTLQKESDAERGESFVLRQPRFTANSDMRQHGNILAYDLMQ